MKTPVWTRRWVPAVFAAVLVFGLAVPGLARDRNRKVEFVQIRIEGRDTVRIEMPAPILEYVLEHGSDSGFIHLGEVDGKAVRFPKEKLLKIIRAASADQGRTPFFSVTDSSGQDAKFYAKTYTRELVPSKEKPTQLVLLVKDKGKKKPDRIAVSLNLVNSIAGAAAKDGKNGGTDVGPFIRTCLDMARHLGSGPFIHIVSDDSDVSFQLQ